MEEQPIGKPLEDYIRAKHTQEECIGFIDGFHTAKKLTPFSEEDMVEYGNWCRIHDNAHPNEVWNKQQLWEKYKKEKWL